MGAKKGGPRLSMKSREAISGYIFFLPWIIGFLIFSLYPTIYSIQLSFNAVRLDPSGIEMNFKGGYFYNYMWNTDVTFRTSLSSTMMTICCYTPVILVFALIIALLLNRKFIGRSFFRVLFFFPVIIMSGPAITNLLTKHTLNFAQDSPMLMSIIEMLPKGVQTPILFILGNLSMILWFSGVQILIYLAGLQKIGPELYEAADIDGAGTWEKFWKITLPFMTPIILLNAVYTVIDVASSANNAVNQQITAMLLDTKGIYSFSAAISWIYFLFVMLVLLVLGVIAVLLMRGNKNG